MSSIKFGCIIQTDLENSTMEWVKSSKLMVKNIVKQNYIFRSILDVLKNYCSGCLKINEIGDSWILFFSGKKSCYIGLLWAQLAQYYCNKYMSSIKIRIALHYGVINFTCFKKLKACEIFDTINDIHIVDKMESDTIPGGIMVSEEFNSIYIKQLNYIKLQQLYTKTKSLMDKRITGIRNIKYPIQSKIPVFIFFIQFKYTKKDKNVITKFIEKYIFEYTNIHDITVISIQNQGLIWNFKTQNIIDYLEFIKYINKKFTIKSTFHYGYYYKIIDKSEHNLCKLHKNIKNISCIQHFKRYISHSQNIAARLLSKIVWNQLSFIQHTHIKNKLKYKKVYLKTPFKGLHNKFIYISKIK